MQHDLGIQAPTLKRDEKQKQVHPAFFKKRGLSDECFVTGCLNKEFYFLHLEYHSNECNKY